MSQHDFARLTGQIYVKPVEVPKRTLEQSMDEIVKQVVAEAPAAVQSKAKKAKRKPTTWKVGDEVEFYEPKNKRHGSEKFLAGS